MEYLRAVACSLVICGHICLIGCISPDIVRMWVPTITTAPYPVAAGNGYAEALIALSAGVGLNVGHLGVTLFFLLSGFVILRSLDRETVASFVVRRVFRILPCCAAAVAATLVLVAGICRLDGVPNPLTLADGLASATVTMNLLHHLPVMPVLWSLEVEVAFYAVMAVIAAAGGRIGTRPLFAAALASSNAVFVLLGLSRAAGIAPEAAVQLVHLSQILLYLPLMLVGAAVYRCWSEGWRRGSTPRVAAFLAVFAAAYLSYGSLAGWDNLSVDATAVVLALALFAAAVAWRRESRWLAPLRFVGAISYPLYLVHAPLGWVVLAAMASHGFSVHAACGAAVLASVLVAWTFHVAVERPGQRLGAALAARLRLRPAGIGRRVAEGAPA